MGKAGINRIVFITPETPPHGFAAAGFEQLLCAPGNAAERLDAAIGQRDVGVVIIDERLLESIDEKRLRHVQERWAGILLVLPSPAGAVPLEEDYLQRLMRRALGYHVRIRQ